VSFLTRIFGTGRERESYRPLYDSVVNAGREPAWYLEGQVPDTIDGRFDTIAALLALVLLRMERDEAKTRVASVLLMELFIDDMEGSVRQIGVGDLKVGKHVGRMVGALGGRLNAFREAAAAGAGFESVVLRNVFHDAPPSPSALQFVTGRLEAFHQALQASSIDVILEGKLPRL
jgi:cytochrome b pre-mRNA-processing protein 3